jgi:Protein of unknown function (DUF3460)
MAKYYESDITRMFRQLLAEKPNIREEQKKGRSLWWDKKLDLDLQRRKSQSRVAQEAYAYQPKPRFE